ncbi:MAG: TolC family protein [Aquificae bacterium]|nr:TolC family protein [Aquificota bacterium]
MLVLLLLVSLSFGVTLDEALKKALEKNLYLKALRQELKAFEGRKRAARALENPELNFESGFVYTSDGSGPQGRFLYLAELAQPLPLWGVRSRRLAVVEAQELAAKEELRGAEKETLGRVYEAFAEALYRKELLRIAREELKLAFELERFVEKAYELGGATLLDYLRAKRERRLVQTDLKLAEKDYRRALKELSALLAEKVDGVEGRLESVKPLKPFKPSNSPLVRRWAFKEEELKRAVKLERALAKPPLSVGLLVEDAGAYYGLRLTFSSRLPLFYRRQGEILEKTALLEGVRLKRRNAEYRLKLELESLKDRYAVLKKELEFFEKELLPGAEEELEVALRGFRLGTVSFFELIDARRRYYELLRRRAELYRGLHGLYARFIALGGEP